MNFSAGDCIPLTELDENVVAMYVQDVKEKLEEVFFPFKKLCKRREVWFDSPSLEASQC